MKKVLLLVAAVVLLAAAPAPAKNVTVDISQLGFVPASVTVQTGDVVTWTNKDTANHQVVCATCPFTSPVLSPGQTFTFTFTKVGKFATVDPLNKNKKGTVTVAAAPATLSLTATPRVMNYGSTTALTGALSPAQANQKIEILGQACGDNAAKLVSTVTTTANGSFTYAAQTTLNTSYQARYKPAGSTITSAAVAVSIRPIVLLRRNAAHRFTAQVVAAQSFVGKAVVFQRWVASKHKWTTVKTVFFGSRKTAATPVAGSTVSGVTFGARLRSGLSVRAVLPSGQAGPCYVSAKSRTIRS